MYYFQFFIEDDKKKPESRNERINRLRRLAWQNNCRYDIEEHADYSTMRVETSDKQDAMFFKMSAEPPLAEGLYQPDGSDVIARR